MTESLAERCARAASPTNDLFAYARQFEMPLDRWISFAVKVLTEGGIETYESCEGGEGHSFPEPTVRFHGNWVEGFRAYTVAVNYGLPVFGLRRFWSVTDGELTGPSWELVFFPLARLKQRQREAELAFLRAPAKP